MLSQDQLQGTINQLDELYEQLEEVYYSRRGYNIPKKEQQLVDATGGSATYGEIMPEGVQAFLRAVPLGPDDVFCDLGSGLGRLTLQVAAVTRVRASVGIELSTTRHEQAEWAVEQAAARRLLQSPVELVVGDITDPALDLRGASHFFLCSTAFGATACRRIADMLSRTPGFKVLVTSRALPFQTSLMRVGEFKCAYSWNLSGSAYVYCRPLPHAPADVLARFWAEPDIGAAWLPSVVTLPVASPDV